MKKIINVMLSIIGMLSLIAAIQLMSEKNYGASFVGLIFTIGVMYFPIKYYFSKKSIEQKKLDSLNRKLEKLNKREKLKREITEKEILCDCIENYIDIANKNKNTLSDYYCIISFIKILKGQYKKYSAEFDKYLDTFEKQGIFEKYNEDDVVIKYYSKYGTNPEVADEIKREYIEESGSRYINFMIAIAICGKPDTSYSRMILSEIYSWNYSCFYKQVIFYTTLYLKNGIDRNYLIGKMGSYSELKKLHLSKMYSRLAKAYRQDKDYDRAIKYCKKAVKYDSYEYKTLADIYRKKNGIDSAITFLENEMLHLKNRFNSKRKNAINENLEKLKKEKNYTPRISTY